MDMDMFTDEEFRECLRIHGCYSTDESRSDSDSDSSNKCFEYYEAHRPKPRPIDPSKDKIIVIGAPKKKKSTNTVSSASNESQSSSIKLSKSQKKRRKKKLAQKKYSEGVDSDVFASSVLCDNVNVRGESSYTEGSNKHSPSFSQTLNDIAIQNEELKINTIIYPRVGTNIALDIEEIKSTEDQNNSFSFSQENTVASMDPQIDAFIDTILGLRSEKTESMKNAKNEWKSKDIVSDHVSLQVCAKTDRKKKTDCFGSKLFSYPPNNATEDICFKKANITHDAVNSNNITASIKPTLIDEVHFTSFSSDSTSVDSTGDGQAKEKSKVETSDILSSLSTTQNDKLEHANKNQIENEDDEESESNNINMSLAEHTGAIKKKTKKRRKRNRGKKPKTISDSASIATKNKSESQIKETKKDKTDSIQKNQNDKIEMWRDDENAKPNGNKKSLVKNNTKGDCLYNLNGIDRFILEYQKSMLSQMFIRLSDEMTVNLNQSVLILKIISTLKYGITSLHIPLSKCFKCISTVIRKVAVSYENFVTHKKLSFDKDEFLFHIESIVLGSVEQESQPDFQILNFDVHRHIYELFNTSMLRFVKDVVRSLFTTEDPVFFCNDVVKETYIYEPHTVPYLEMVARAIRKKRKYTKSASQNFKTKNYVFLLNNTPPSIRKFLDAKGQNITTGN